MAKDPAVLFYTGDFLTGTFTMTHEQKGKYITLLCLQHQQGHLSEKHMLSVCSAYDADIWCKFKQDDDGNYYNQRMEDESAKRCKYTESRRSNALKKDSISEAYTEAYAEHMPKHMDKHMENGNRNENRNRNIDEKGGSVGKEFNVFWSAYPKKVGKGAAIKAYEKVKVDKAILLSAIEKQSRSEQWTKDDGKYIPNPSTWLNQCRWEDELPGPKTMTAATYKPPEPVEGEMERMMRMLKKVKGE